MNPFRKPILITMLAALLIGAAAFAFSAFPVFAQATTPTNPAPQNPVQPDKPGPVIARLEKIYQNELMTLERQAGALAKADQLVKRVEALISKWQAKGVDTSKIEAALKSFQGKLADAQIAHDKAANILQNHAGFDAQGKVDQRGRAIQTVKDAGDALKDAHSALADGRRVLVDFLKTWQEEHKPVKTTS